MNGDRSGHVHIGFNQSLYIGTGKLPNDLSVYHSGEVTLQGELRVAGVNVEVLLKQFVCRFWFQSQSQDNLKELSKPLHYLM
jgi:hypothetical protein